MDSEPEVVTPAVVDEQEEHHAHIPVTDNGRAYCSTVKDHDNPYSVWSLANERLKDCIDRSPDDLFLLDEQVLMNMINRDARLTTIRMSFHREYERVMALFQRTGKLQVLRASNIYGGICSQKVYERYLTRPECLVYMTLPVVDFHDGLKALSATLLNRYDEILKAPLYDKKGNFSAKTAEVVLKAMKSVEDRVWGQSIQRVSSESKSVQVTVPIPGRSVQKTTDLMLVLDHRVKELQAELYGIRRLGEMGHQGANDNRKTSSPQRWIDGTSDSQYDPSEDWEAKRLAKLLAKEGEVVSGEEGQSASHSDQTTTDR